MPDSEEVKVVAEVESQFGRGTSYAEGRRLSWKAILGCTAAGIAALVPTVFLSSPEKTTSEESGVRVPDGIEVEGGAKDIRLGSYSATTEQKARGIHRPVVIRYAGLESISRPQASHLPPGSLIKAVLVSGASNGPVRAELREPLGVNGETLLPVGTVLLGSGQSSDTRLFIHFTEAVFRNGERETIDAAAIDGSDKIAGLRGSTVGHYATKLAAAIGLNFVSGMADGLEQKEAVGQQVVSGASPRNALLNGASRASLDLANETMSDLKNKPSVIEVEAGREILVLFGATE